MSTRKTHPINVSHLVVGLVFLGIAGSWALRAADVVDSSEVGWLLPLTLVAAGAIGLVAFAAKNLVRGRDRDEDPSVEALEAAAFAPYEDDAFLSRPHSSDTEMSETRTYDTQTVEPTRPDDTEGDHR